MPDASNIRNARQTAAAEEAASAPLIIAIDGPSGAGKSTLGRRLAHELGLLYLDTGAMYRAVALRVLRAGVAPTDAPTVAAYSREARIELAGEADRLQVWLDGEEVSGSLRTPEVAQAASVISTNSEVRREMVRRQREIGNSAAHGVVLDGRDIGTVVFPNASVKFFLTATPEQRAARRVKEEHAADFQAVLHDIQERDSRDSSRLDSPLAIADDAIVIDSTEEGIDEVLERMITTVRERSSLTDC